MNVARLSNGLTLFVAEGEKRERVELELHLIGAGGYYDPPDAPGIAVFVTMVNGACTTTRSTRELGQELEQAGVDLWMKSLGSSIAIQMFVNASEQTMKLALSQMADRVRNPTFEPEMFDESARSTKTYLEQIRATTRYGGDEAFARAIYGDHPAARQRSKPSDLDVFTRERVLAFVKARYAPDHSVLAIAGGPTLAEIQPLAEKYFGSWQPLGLILPPVREPAPPVQRTLLVHAEQDAELRVGTLVVNRASADFEVLEIINVLLGLPQVPARLTQTLRDERKLTDGASWAIIAPQKVNASWVIKASARPENAVAALECMLAELGRLRDELVPEAELTAAKELVLRYYVEMDDTPHGVLKSLIGQWMHGHPADYREQRTGRISAITPERVREVAQRYLTPSRLVTVIVGPRPLLEAPLRQAVGDLAIVNSDVDSDATVAAR